MSERLTGHTVVRDVLGFKLLRHPLSCRVRPADCPVTDAINHWRIRNNVAGQKGRGEWLVKLHDDGTVSLLPISGAGEVADEFKSVMDWYVDEVGFEEGLAAMIDWVKGQKAWLTSIEQKSEPIDCTMMDGTEFDPEWEFTDMNGHFHEASVAEDGEVYFTSLFKLVATEEDGDGWPYPVTVGWQCDECGQRIEPGKRTRGSEIKSIPGPIEVTFEFESRESLSKEIEFEWQGERWRGFQTDARADGTLVVSKFSAVKVEE